MKTNKHQTLLLVRDKESIRSKDVSDEFNYSPGTARSYISYLSRQGLLERSGAGYILTEKGRNRLQHFEIVGCGNIECPFCLEKKSGYFACPKCGFQIEKGKAKLSPEMDYILAVKHSGVYCPECDSLLFTPIQAKLLGVKEG